MTSEGFEREIEKSFDDGRLYPEAKACFRICPLCCNEGSISMEAKRVGMISAELHIFCKKCGAKWYLHEDSWSGKLKGVRLVNVGTSGRGNDLLENERPPEFWQEMGLKSLKGMSSSDKQEKVVKEREVIVKEIVKIRCPYCRKLYDESNDKCPNCGASR